MKLIFVLILFITNSWAKKCSEIGIELSGEVIFHQIHQNQKIKASKFFRLPASWNSNSNNFYSLVIKSSQKIDEVELKSLQCRGCIQEKQTKKSFTVKHSNNYDYYSKEIKLNSLLNSSFLYPGYVELNLKHKARDICSHRIELRRIK